MSPSKPWPDDKEGWERKYDEESNLPYNERDEDAGSDDGFEVDDGSE